jgi:hypothetical protein
MTASTVIMRFACDVIGVLLSEITNAEYPNRSPVQPGDCGPEHRRLARLVLDLAILHGVAGSCTSSPPPVLAAPELRGESVTPRPRAGHGRAPAASPSRGTTAPRLDQKSV